jgi:hypothetical protein
MKVSHLGGYANRQRAAFICKRQVIPLCYMPYTNISRKVSIVRGIIAIREVYSSLCSSLQVISLLIAIKPIDLYKYVSS